MGWSCRAEAGNTYQRIWKACAAQTGTSNVWVDKNGDRFMEERTDREWDDGRITGTIYRFVDDERVVKVGGFTISPEGVVTRGTKAFKALAS